ncbi:uncharacterized protein LOC141785259 [Halichoeres trimaculatus]|uniref:uncharacterized protein LOC141785259 n=1 Tax=Halichoeres trimaculatus TaxID=147232 RepID=UPI003D9F7AB3
MLPGLSQRVSWICLLLFSSAVCFPAIDDYQYSYTDASTDDTAAQTSVEEPAPEPTMEMSAEDEMFSPRSGVQQPAAAQQQAGSQSENQGPSGSATASWASYQPSNYGVSSTSRAGPSYSAPAAAYSPTYAAAPAPSYTTPAAHGGFRGHGASGGYGGYGAAYDGAAEGPSSAGTLVYSGGAPSFRFEGPGFGNEYAPLPMVGFESFNPNGWMPSRSFPDFTVWGAGEVANEGSKHSKGVKGVQQEEEEVETFSVPASSYIVQTRNGYQRAREVSSHMNYAPIMPEPAVIYYEVKQKVAPQDEPVKGGKGQTQQIGL